MKIYGNMLWIDILTTTAKCKDPFSPIQIQIQFQGTWKTVYLWGKHISDLYALNKINQAMI